MSVYRESSTTLHARVSRALLSLVEEHEPATAQTLRAIPLGQAIRLPQLAELGHDRTGLAQAAQAVQSAVPDHPGLSHPWRDLREQALTAAGHALTRTDHDGLREAGDEVRAVGEQIAAAAATAHRRAVAVAVADALPDLGYTLHRADHGSATAFTAARGHESMLVVITEDATIVTDHAGLTDATCEERQDAFLTALGDRGVTTTAITSRGHCDPRGGALIAAAARAGGSRAAAAARLADQAHRSGTTRLHDTPSTTSTLRTERAR